MLAGVAQAAGPSYTVGPTITGTVQQGQPLTVQQANWSDTTGTINSITDVWEVCAPACAANGQTGLTYTPTATDVGHTIEVVESAIATDGSASATAGPTGPVLPPPPPANTAPPTIAGIAQQGQTLTASPGTWSNSPTAYAYQWNSCAPTCTPITGATGATYLVPPTEIGKTLDVTVTASNASGPGAPATSAATAAVLPAAPAIVVAPTITGIAQQGQTLTLTQGTWANSPTAISDQWESCTALSCVPIPGQVGAAYTLGPADVGHAIEVVETATNTGVIPPAAPPTATSAPTAVVTATSYTSLVSFSTSAPTTNQPVALVATVSSSSGNAAPSGSLSFLDGPTPIPGCTGKPVRGGLAVTVICEASFPAGTHQITATYVPGPGSIVAGSTSSPDGITIGRDSTSVSLAVTKQISPGSRAMYSATLVLPASNSGPIQPTGSIEFLDQGQPIPGCMSQSLTNLTATCTVQYASPGTHDISAAYSGDSNFDASSSPSTTVQVVKNSTAPPVLGFVRSTLQWTFYYHPRFTNVILLTAFRILPGTKVLVTCNGRGCPFHTMRRTRKRRGSINLLPAFRHRNLRAGARITIRLTHANWVGKYYSFTIRGGHPPAIHEACLAVGRSVPGAGC